MSRSYVRTMFRTNPPNFRKPTSLRQIAEACMLDLETSGGFSRDKHGNVPIAPGYMVSVPNCERRMIFVSVHDIYAFLFNHPLRMGEFWGGWKDNGMNVLDVSLQVMSRSDALELARIFGQSAIYDLETKDNIFLPKVPPKLPAHTGMSGCRIQGDDARIGNWYAYDYDRAWQGPSRMTQAEAEKDLEQHKLLLQGSAYDVMSDIANAVEHSGLTNV